MSTPVRFDDIQVCAKWRSTGRAAHDLHIKKLKMKLIDNSS
jgi:hypothetical protein